MKISPIILTKFNKNSSLNKDFEFETKFLKKLPVDYQNLLREFYGGEGFIGDEYLILYSSSEIEKYNAECEIHKFDKEIFIIGSNGSGEFIAIDMRNNEMKYILIPNIFEYDAIIELGNNYIDFFESIYNYGYFK